MKIATETERIVQAKADLKSELNNRGITVGNDTIDTFAEHLSSYPYIVKGSFTPEEDTKEFNLTTGFKPVMMLINCGDLILSARNGEFITGALNFICAERDEWAQGSYQLSNGTTILNVSPTSSSVSLLDDGVSIVFADSSSIVFKAGYTYSYYIVGGVAE